MHAAMRWWVLWVCVWLIDDRLLVLFVVGCARRSDVVNDGSRWLLAGGGWWVAVASLSRLRLL